MARELNQNNFETEVLQSPVPVLVDFHAPWCGPCRMLAPTLDELDRESQGNYRVVKVNTDDAPLLAQQYGVTALPTIAVFDQGKVVRKLIGLQNKAVLRQALGQLVG